MATKRRAFWAVEVTDPHPIHGGKTVKFPFACREHAELWARDEVAAARDLGILGVTTRIYRAHTGQNHGGAAVTATVRGMEG